MSEFHLSFNGKVVKVNASSRRNTLLKLINAASAIDPLFIGGLEASRFSVYPTISQGPFSTLADPIPLRTTVNYLKEKGYGLFPERPLVLYVLNVEESSDTTLPKSSFSLKLRYFVVLMILSLSTISYLTLFSTGVLGIKIVFPISNFVSVAYTLSYASSTIGIVSFYLIEEEKCKAKHWFIWLLMLVLILLIFAISTYAYHLRFSEDINDWSRSQTLSSGTLIFMLLIFSYTEYMINGNGNQSKRKEFTAAVIAILLATLSVHLRSYCFDSKGVICSEGPRLLAYASTMALPLCRLIILIDS